MQSRDNVLAVQRAVIEDVEATVLAGHYVKLVSLLADIGGGWGTMCCLVAATPVPC
jgi:hypothetical protein